MKAETKAILFGGAVVLLAACFFSLSGFNNFGLSSLAGGLIGAVNLWLVGLIVRSLRPGAGQGWRPVFLFLLKWVFLAGSLLGVLKAGFSMWGILLGFLIILVSLSVTNVQTIKNVHRS